MPGTSGTSGWATFTYTTAGLVTFNATRRRRGRQRRHVDGQPSRSIDPSIVDAPTAVDQLAGATTPPSRAPIPVIGTVSDPQNALLSWTLTITPNDTGELPSDDGLPQNNTTTTIATGTAPITNGTLGTLDPTLLANGYYTLTLTDLNAGGLTAVEQRERHRQRQPEARRLEPLLYRHDGPGRRHPHHHHPQLLEPRRPTSRGTSATAGACRCPTPRCR